MEQITPFQARLNLFAFLCVAGIIATNALYFQKTTFSSNAEVPVEEKKPKPRKTSRTIIPEAQKRDEQKDIITGSGSTQSIQRTELSNRDIITDEISSDTVKAVQRELLELGYVTGGIDGAPGIVTRAAVLAFEYDHGLPLTANPSERVLEMMLFRVPKAERSSVRPGEMSAMSRKIVQHIQKELNVLGYSSVSVNGLPGKDTEAAIREFEKDRELEITGRVSGRLIQELIKFTDIPTEG